MRMTISVRLLWSLTLTPIHGQTAEPNDESSRDALAVRGSTRRVVPAHHAVWRGRFRRRSIRQEWFGETMAYMTDRYPELGAEQIGELRKLGERFAQPPKKRDDTAAA